MRCTIEREHDENEMEIERGGGEKGKIKCERELECREEKGVKVKKVKR